MNWNPISWLPWTREGRQTLIYISIALSSPVLCGLILFALHTIRNWDGPSPENRLDRFADIAMLLGWGLMIVLVSYACFISIRALKLNVKDGTAEVDGGNEGKE